MNLVNVKPSFVRHSAFDRIFNDFVKGQHLDHPLTARPSANIIDQEKAFVIELAIPGIPKDALNIAVEKNILTITSTKEEANQDSIRYTKKEFQVQNFERKFKLNEKVLTDAIEAKLENGILQLTIPKAAEVYTKQLIEVA